MTENEKKRLFERLKPDVSNEEIRELGEIIPITDVLESLESDKILEAEIITDQNPETPEPPRE